MKLLTIGAGCFWCIEAAFAEVKGIHSAISGYMGGPASLANYRAVCDGDSGHVEVVQLTYDEQQLPLELLFEMFCMLHDPTSWDRQGNDCGSQYRSVWFYHERPQAETAQHAIAQWNEAHPKTPMVTEVRAASEFFAAESYHQGYAKANPQQPYCALLIAPKLQKFRKQFAEYLK